MILKEVIDQYSRYRLLNRRENTVAMHEQTLKRLCLYLRNPDTMDITLDDVVGYLWGMKDLGWNPNSIREQACIFRRFFHYCRLTELSSFHEELIPVPRAVPKEHNVVTKEEHALLVKALIEKTDPRNIRNVAIIALLHDTGVRNGELLALQVSALNLERMKCTIRTEKDRSDAPWRQVFWTSHAHEHLMRWLTKREYLIKEKKMFLTDPDALFFGIAGPKSGQPLSRNGLDVILRYCSKKAGIRTINPHAYRHAFGHDLADKGAEDSTIASMLGHATPASSYTYTKSSGLRLEQKYRKYHEA